MVTSKEYIKKLTTIPETFIDELFEFYDVSTTQTDHVVKLDAVAKWLHARKDTLVLTLKKSYKQHIDYIVTKPSDYVKKSPHANHYKLYLLTPDCFKRLAMMSRSKNAEMIRSYFIEIEGLFIKYREQTLEGMRRDIESLERNQRPKKLSEQKPGYLYIIRASDTKDGLYKIGRTKNDLVQRMKQYEVGKADDVEVLYTYRADDVVGAEGCLKAYLKKYQYRKYKEVYQTDLQMIKEFMKSCSDIGAKLVQKSTTSKMKGGYYIILDRIDHTTP
jgi:phage anti-repressor protein